MAFKNLNDIEKKEIYPGYKAKFIHTENITLAHWTIKKGSFFPEHMHPHEQVLSMLEGKFELTVGFETKILEPGDVAIIPPNVSHSGKALEKTKAIDIFYPYREDYL